MIIHGNVLATDIVEATGVFVYLVPAGMSALKEALVSRLRAGARVVTYGECLTYEFNREVLARVPPTVRILCQPSGSHELQLFFLSPNPALKLKLEEHATYYSQ